MKKYTNNNPQFFDEIDVVETTDPNHADNINKADKQVLENTLVNRQDIQQLDKNKVDKINGKDLSTNDYTTAEKNKLAGIAEKANNYVHPASHPADMITQDATHRFVSDDEKKVWNTNKSNVDTHVSNNTIHITSQERTNWNVANSKKHSHSNKSVLDGITSALIDTWNKVTDKLDRTGDASNTTTSFSTASTRTNIATGEKLSISLGKIAKWFSELKTVAFTGNYIDLSNKPTIPTVGNGTITITQNGTNKGSFTTNQNGNTTIALSDNNTTYSTGNVSTLGLTKLYAETGTAIDGTMTQKAIKSALDNKLSISGGTVNGDIVPDKDETYDLGHEDKKWDNMWAHTLEADYINAQDGIRGNLTGNADTATKAVKDNAGDNIITSYRKRMGKVKDNDFNNATVEGVYIYGSSTTMANGYSSGSAYGILEVFNSRYNGGAGVQDTILIQVAYTTNNNIYIRQRVNTLGWTAWREIDLKAANGEIKVTNPAYSNGYVRMWVDKEGGNIEIQSPDGATTYQLDAYSNDIIRIFSNNADGSHKFLQFNGKTGVLSADGGFAGNAASAAKLAKIISIFGQTFDGTSSVAGNASVHGKYIDTAGLRFQNGGLEIRENDLIGNKSADEGYAPAIGFHWANRTAGNLILGSDGHFYFKDQKWNRACVDANINGNVNGHTVNADVPANAKFTDNNTTYGAGTGIGLSNTTFYNTGVRSIATGSTNGTMAVNTNGTVVDVPVKGLGALAYASGTWNKISGTNCTIYYNEVAVYLEISAQGVNLTEYGGTATNKNIVVLPTNVIPTKGAFLGAISALNSAWVPLNKTVVCDLTYNSRNLILRPAEALSNVTLNLTAMFPRSLFTIN